jgi:hypothetical protein
MLKPSVVEYDHDIHQLLTVLVGSFAACSESSLR